jgi:hypothetical protein
MAKAFTTECEGIKGWQLICPDTQVKLAPFLFYLVLAMFIMMVIINNNIAAY